MRMLAPRTGATEHTLAEDQLEYRPLKQMLADRRAAAGR